MKTDYYYHLKKMITDIFNDMINDINNIKITVNNKKFIDEDETCKNLNV